MVDEDLEVLMCLDVLMCTDRSPSEREGAHRVETGPVRGACLVEHRGRDAQVQGQDSVEGENGDVAWHGWNGTTGVSQATHLRLRVPGRVESAGVSSAKIHTEQT